ncbi:MAG: hypothetical protein Q8R28_12345, partial [Dehalococcoidia bacterium]|nr:hypothetical protein [Dehalococcoidia bacterium]
RDGDMTNLLPPPQLQLMTALSHLSDAQELLGEEDPDYETLNQAKRLVGDVLERHPPPSGRVVRLG